MITSTVFVLRNAEHKNKELTELWIRQSIKKWKEIIELTKEISNKVIKIIAADSNRSIQTARYIAQWMWIENPEIIHAKDWKYEGLFNMQVTVKMTELIHSNLVLLIIWHVNNVWPLAKQLWYKWEVIKFPEHLECYELKVQQKKSCEVNCNWLLE